VLLPTELARQAAPSSVQPRPVLPVSRSRSRRQLFAPKQFNGAYLTTPEGWSLIIIGCGVGFLFAVVALCVSVVSFPLMLDRHATAIDAIRTSVRAVMKNPFAMAVWGLIVAALLVIGSLPLFVGLCVVLPVLGHATWHLYRKVVEPDPNPPQEQPRAPKGHRYAADFPASLFPWSRERGP
jgi:Predicted integral membrane protein (DUF2189)